MLTCTIRWRMVPFESDFPADDCCDACDEWDAGRRKLVPVITLKLTLALVEEGLGTVAAVTVFLGGRRRTGHLWKHISGVPVSDGSVRDGFGTCTDGSDSDGSVRDGIGTCTDGSDLDAMSCLHVNYVVTLTIICNIIMNTEHMCSVFRKHVRLRSEMIYPNFNYVRRI